MAEPLKPEELARRCNPEELGFTTTEEVPILHDVIGQERAMRALDFGLGLVEHGYNIYVLGESGTGRTSIVKARLEEKAKDEKVPDDWCYVYNFHDPDRPRAINLPPGKGSAIRDDMDELLEAVRRNIPRVFESKDYERHRDEILEGQQERTRALFQRLEKLAAERGFLLKKTPAGLAVVPTGKDGGPLSQKEYEELSREKKQEIDENTRFLQERLNDAVREARNIEKETKERIDALDREVAQYVVNPLINELIEKYREFDNLVSYLEEVREDILRNIDAFRPKEEFSPFGIKLPRPEPSFERYKINLVVNHRDTRGAPVVVETNPTYYNLFGKIEYRFQYGVAVTDFTMIKAGSIHRANGGYLVVNALDILRNIFVYDALKRTIKNREVRIEDVWEQYRLVSATTLKPSPIPLDVKVVVIGEPLFYYLLYNYDPEYRKLFKVKADFESVLPRTVETASRYAQFVAEKCKEKSLMPFHKEAVARIIEYGSRIAQDKERLTARFSMIEDLVVEANYWARQSGRDVVTAEDVVKAREEMEFRHSKIEDRLRELITEDTIMITTDGTETGQVNGIAVIDLGDYAFGKPSRITARIFTGDEGVVGIEREVKMSGRIHNKAQMILKSFLGERFARDFPLTLSASICFEQLYEEVEGDSATCTELYALCSSLAGVPLNQGIAVTGSMNQKGEVQPVGGINEKIEGFFDVCKEKGLTGRQGVIIPKRNVKNLMLKDEVVEAVREGRFAIYPIEHVDEGMEILASMPAGTRGADGKFQEGTINRLVEDRLHQLATSYKEFGRRRHTEEKGGKRG